MNQRNPNVSLQQEAKRDSDIITPTVIDVTSIRKIVGGTQAQRLERALANVPQEIDGVEMAGIKRMFVDEVKKLLTNGNDRFSHRIAALMSGEMPSASNDNNFSEAA